MPLITILAFLPSLDVFSTRYLSYSTTDISLYFRHSFHFAAQSLLGGRVPLWNPHILCGTPFLPSTCATLWYPVNWLPLFLLSQPLSLNLIMIVHVALLGVFTVYYARVRERSNTAALFAGIVSVYCFLPAVRVPAGHITIVCTIAWIPVLFALQERLFNRGSLYILPFAFAAACAFLAGHLQYVYYCLLLLAVNLVIISFLQRRGRSWILKQILYHAAAGFVAFGLAAVEVLQVLNSLRYSVRGTSKTIEWLGFFSMPPENFLTMISPGVFGLGDEYSGKSYWWEVCFYVGIMPLILALTEIWRQVRSRRLNNHTILLIMCMFLSVMGLLGPLAYLGYAIPGWSSFRGHAKILGLGAVFAVMLAAEGFDAVLRAPRGAAGKAAMRIACLVVLLTILVYIGVGAPGVWESDSVVKARAASAARTTDSSQRGISPQAALLSAFIIAGGAAGLLLLRRSVGRTIVVWGMVIVSTLDLAAFALPLYNVTFSIKELPRPPPEIVSFARENQNKGRCDDFNGIYLNEAISSHYEAAAGYDYTITKYWDTFISAFLGEKGGVTRMNLVITHDSPLLDCANLRYLMIPDWIGVPAGFSVTKQKTSANVSLFERKSALPRAYVVGTARWVSNDQAELILQMRGRKSFDQDVILCEPRVNFSDERFDAVPAEIVYDSPEALRITSPRAGWLVVCDSFHPLWRGWINAVPARIFRANAAFRAVRVNAGDKVLMRFVNPWFRIGAAISTATLFGAGLAFLLQWRRRPAAQLL